MKRAYLATSYTWKSKWAKLPIIGKVLGRFVEHVRMVRVSKATAALLQSTGWNIFSPITHSHLIPKWIPERLNTHTFWLGLDFDWIKQCDEMWVFMQPGWMDSYGVIQERKLCARLGKKVRYIHMDYTFDYQPETYILPKD